MSTKASVNHSQKFPFSTIFIPIYSSMSSEEQQPTQEKNALDGVANGLTNQLLGDESNQAESENQNPNSAQQEEEEDQNQNGNPEESQENNNEEEKIAEEEEEEADDLADSENQVDDEESQNETKEEDENDESNSNDQNGTTSLENDSQAASQNDGDSIEKLSQNQMKIETSKIFTNEEEETKEPKQEGENIDDKNGSEVDSKIEGQSEQSLSNNTNKSVRFSSSSIHSQSKPNESNERSQSDMNAKTLPPPDRRNSNGSISNKPVIKEPESKAPSSPRHSPKVQQQQQSSENEEEEIPPSPPPRSNRTQQLSDDEMKKLVKSIVKGQKSIDRVQPRYLSQLIDALKEDRDEKIARRKPDEAEVSDSYLVIARHLYNEHAKAQAQQQRESEMRERLAIALEDLEALKNQFALEEAEINSEQEAKVMELLDKQAKEDAEFRESWRTPRKLRIYNRTSNQLRSLRTQTILLLNARMYPEMRQVDRLAKKQEEIETIENYHTMNADYVTSHQNLERKHHEEMKVLINAQEVQFEQRQALAKIRLDIAQKRVNNLKKQYEDAQDPDKVWNLFHRNDRSKAGTKKSQSRRAMEARNYATLSLPPLQGPKSARRMTRSMRYGEMY
ncbi:hypothetical protein TRFO_12423 [Tritrichomonas foetus]|uniref:Uncharacterized protein n=1 Tax=Tritrichomonas foetus TaxID=1144522 RepID=A0A1J4L611_9EUKA|nr:hypothetical protein TRFO_12423 [Tritrichomonas foetus]|eukprot:OHT17452.1 hypothetical protein TRFO_12423 [Tritrichomonas foetus]